MYKTPLLMRCATLALVLQLLTPTAQAQNPSPAALPLAPGAHLSGGIGLDARDHMQALKGQYALHLSFAQAKSGSYVAGVEVRIEDVAKGTVFGPYPDSGPWLYVALPPGQYQVRASAGGITQTATVSIAQKPVSKMLYWPLQDAAQP